MAVAGPYNRIGPAGPKGTTGPKGKDGVDGLDGKNGKNGRDGKDGITTVITQGSFNAGESVSLATNNDSSVVFICNETVISALRLVYADSPTTVKIADQTNFQTAKVLGLAKTSAVFGADITVLLEGIHSDPSFLFPVGALLYLGLNGQITNVPPNENVLTLVGQSLGSGKIILRIEQPIIL